MTTGGDIGCTCRATERSTILDGSFFCSSGSESSVVGSTWYSMAERRQTDYVRALIQYGRWLRENYADLEHKEVWQSLLFLACVLRYKCGVGRYQSNAI